MVSELQLGDLTVQVLKKDIKNVHLSVYPPHGEVKVSAPNEMPLDTLRVFVISKLTWIKKQQQKLQAQARESARDFVERESHYFKGERYLLKVTEHNSPPPKIELDHQYMMLYIRPNTSTDKRAAILNEWYRVKLKQQIPELITKYEKLMDVSVNEFGVKKMKTKWGTCNPIAQRIWLNLELAKKPSELLEYVVVHEMVHLLERSHNRRFVLLMDRFMPKWRFYKDELNRLPISHVDWMN